MKIVYMWTAIEETNIKAILADMNTNELVVKIRTEKKNSGPYEIWTQRSWEVMGDHGFKSRTDLNFFSGLIFTTSSVVFITTRIAFIFFTLKYFLFIGCLK